MGLIMQHDENWKKKKGNGWQFWEWKKKDEEAPKRDCPYT